jgi:ribosomal protein S18 acetylase RimI-like enzyme
MRYSGVHRLKDGEEILLRSARAQDAASNIEYVQEMDRNTPYHMREPGEFAANIEREEALFKSFEEADRSLMLLAFCGGRLVGQCHFSPVNHRRRLSHRVDFGITVRPGMQGRGIGRLLMQTSLELCKEAGFEQAELEVVSENMRALSLYLSLGFEVVGRTPRLFKMGDGSYFAGYKMVKPL